MPFSSSDVSMKIAFLSPLRIAPGSPYCAPSSSALTAISMPAGIWFLSPCSVPACVFPNGSVSNYDRLLSLQPPLRAGPQPVVVWPGYLSAMQDLISCIAFLSLFLNFTIVSAMFPQKYDVDGINLVVKRKQPNLSETIWQEGMNQWNQDL